LTSGMPLGIMRMTRIAGADRRLEPRAFGAEVLRMRPSRVLLIGLGLICLPVGTVTLVGPVALAADDVVIGTHQAFTDIGLLPTRLTAFNAHDDAAQATYTCCRPDQKEAIDKALKANEAFLNVYPYSDFADDTLMHNARIDSVRKNFRHQVESLGLLVQDFPDSDLADDALWDLADLYCQDKDHVSAVNALNDLVRHYPFSTWADDAYFALARELKELNDEPGAIGALETLAGQFPKSDHCAEANWLLGEKYMSVGEYGRAIDAFTVLIRRYPCADLADDAQFNIAQCFRLMHDTNRAEAAYEYVIHRMPGSSFVPAAMREANSIVQERQGAVVGGASKYERYDLKARNSYDAAKELCELANHHLNYREYRDAIGAFTELVRRFPGIDCYDDALYKIGVAYQQMNVLFHEINKAKGPDDLFRLMPEYKDATRALQGIPTDRQLSSLNDATGAFALVANNLIGSPLRDDALWGIAEAYEAQGTRTDGFALGATPAEDADVWADHAATCQELLINFPGSEHETRALWSLLKFYADERNYDTAIQMYEQLSRSVPDIFPGMFAETKEDFLNVMMAYYRHADFCWEEYNVHHIPYRLTLPDLIPEAQYYMAGLYLKQGEADKARRLLLNITSRPTCDLAPSATLLLGQTYQLLGDKDKAREAFEYVVDHYALSGLADDARLFISQLDGADAPDTATYAAQVGAAPGAYDIHVGTNVVVIAPYIVSAKMRAYNLPNIWDAAQGALNEWTGVRPEGPVVIVVSDRLVKGPVTISAAVIKDPPRWQDGFRQMARRAIGVTRCASLGKAVPAFVEGLSQFGASSLEYSLVSETRDTIGSAAATVVPHQAVIDQRSRCLDALENYVRDGASLGKLTPDAACGMLYALLDQHGYGKQALVDREPYRRFFEALNSEPQSDPQTALVAAIDKAFGGKHYDQFKQWGFRVDRNRLDRMAHAG
jgi:TolA-binding protein